ncbi:type VI lipase adapter Tla3 domain-containing protein [Achromobacter kerstersii]
MASDSRFYAPSVSERLETLDVLSVGMSVDVYRQGQVWEALRKQSEIESQALLVSTALPMEPGSYPIRAADKDLAWNKRIADALELGLKNFIEKWPIPTATVVRSWDPDSPKLRVSANRTREMLITTVNSYRGDAGLHWHSISMLENGIVCSDNPEGLIERLFQLFERHADLPAVLVFSVEGFNMSRALMDKDKNPIGVGTGPRQPGELSDTIVALVVGRPERVDWLRYYAPFTKVHKNPINPQFTGWGWRKPKVPFQPTKFIPEPWTERAFQQWDALPVLAKLHRPVTVALNNDAGKRLKNDALYAALAKGWNDATQGLPMPPARAFFDTGKPENTALAEWVPTLKLAGSSLDLLASEQSYNLTQRLGDTGSGSPFVGIALATMASYLNADSSIVMPLRRADRATLIPITSPTPGHKPDFNPFGIRLMPQHSSSDGPDPIFVARMHEEKLAQQPTMPTRFIDPEQVARDKQTLDDFLASGPGMDLTDASER